MAIRNMEYVWLANFTGCPAISVPVGYANASGGGGRVPIGLMGMNDWGKEDELMAFGYDVEKWLHDECEGGRQRPENFVDIFAMQ
jgi:Asp-tRNA(Asn)/Glu-tRNA(Gln) amidotransferase A subunit family amidase